MAETMTDSDPLLLRLRSEGVRAAMLDALRAGGVVTDIAFDRIYPERIRRLSPLFWTPVVVARRVARLFEAHGARRVLDIGAGVGKLCIIGALTTGLDFTGVEHREGLASIGQHVIDAFDIPRARVLHGTLDDVDFTEYDGFYLFNPFEEGTFQPSKWVDRSVPLSEEGCRRDVARVEDALARAPTGTRVVTFHGFGGVMPPDYRHLPEETRGTAFLRLWVKS
ncbi:class I SAM-dependent methyltransferase [Polyangium aurulentum]|uniref:class I SAM-dependent methyltransferase n=1 Tax=Polyangium aurulentum TaxID=2567896 RepID=UPI00200E906D|nr:class I SAM-dependent methyltransferase [Polyangium aurulentum]UQA60334.1 class I SAM-dependent methyltransferase [Polyangium aurulentum]